MTVSAISALTGGYQLAFELAAAAVVVGILVAAAVLRMPRDPRATAGSEVAVEV